MPTPRKSIAELAQSGTLGRNLGRYQRRITSQTTAVAPIGRSPKHLAPSERAVWQEVVRSAPPGRLTVSDRLSLEIVCRLIVRIRTSAFKNSELSALMAILGRFGMTPGDRQRMAWEPTPDPALQAAEDAEMAALDELD